MRFERFNECLNERARTLATEHSTAMKAQTKTRTRQIAEEQKAKLDNPDLLSQYNLDLAKQTVLGSLGWDNLDPLTDPNKIGDSVIVSRAMATQDFAALSAWIQTAAIEDALIGSLVVDKLDAGTFTAGDITLAGAGAIKAGGATMNSTGFSAGQVKMDSLGFKLPPVNARESLSLNQSYKIAAPNELTGMYFVKEPAYAITAVQAETNAANTAISELLAIHNKSDFTATNNATMVVRSYNPNDASNSYSAIRARENTVVGKFLIDGKFYPKFTGATTTIASGGGSATWTHSLGTVPNLVEAWCALGNGEFRPAAYIADLKLTATNTTVTVINNGATSRSVYVYIWE